MRSYPSRGWGEINLPTFNVTKYLFCNVGLIFYTIMLVIPIVFFSLSLFFAQHRVPPVDHVFLATLKAANIIHGSSVR